MYKLSLEKAEESELKLPAFVESRRKKENSRGKKKKPNIYFFFINYAKAFDCMYACMLSWV